MRCERFHAGPQPRGRYGCQGKSDGGCRTSDFGPGVNAAELRVSLTSSRLVGCCSSVGGRPISHWAELDAALDTRMANAEAAC